MTVKPLMGVRFGKLFVVCRGSNPRGTKTKDAYWECVCDCGNNTTIQGRKLNSGKITDCGCVKAQELYNLNKVKINALAESKKQRNRSKISKYAGNEASVLHVYRTYKASADKRKLEFNLRIDIFFRITQQLCLYCGRAPETKFMAKGSEIYVYNGIDRLDNNKGYIESNCVPCCKACNTTKGSISINMVIKLYSIYKDRGILEPILNM